MSQHLLNSNTPALAEATTHRSEFDLANLGLRNLRHVYWNLSATALCEEITFRSEGTLSPQEAVLIDSSESQVASESDRFVVRESNSEQFVYWGEHNRPFTPLRFIALLQRMQAYLQGRDLFVCDCIAGADPIHRLPVRIVTELAWPSLFARNLFDQPESPDEWSRFIPEFTILTAPQFQASPEIDGTNSPAFVVLNLEQRLCLIGGTSDAHEIKNATFMVLDYLLTRQGVVTMRCAANQGSTGEVALFVGLPGSGKTTLSADPDRTLIGDDAHGWSDAGIFSLAHGCCTKLNALSPAAELHVHACTHGPGPIIEQTEKNSADRAKDSLADNTRCALPREYIETASEVQLGRHPKNIFLLTCDRSGVMPPIARLTPDQTVYYYVSGYGSQLSPTEQKQVFSPCLTAGCLVHHPARHARLFREKLLRHEPNCWLINTGWMGGPIGVGKRVNVQHIKTLVKAALSGTLSMVDHDDDPVFGYAVPKHCDGLPDQVFQPAEAWPDQKAYEQARRQLAALFIENFKKYESSCSSEVVAAGPRLERPNN